MKNVVEHELNIPADYQYHALIGGNFYQRQWHKNRLTLIRELNFLNSEDIVADVGCGSGNVVLAFADQVKHITGFDYDRDSVRFLNNTVAAGKIENARAVEFDIEQNIQSVYCNHFDKIIFNEVIEHFEESKVEKVLANLYRMLKNKGLLLITTPNYGLSPWEVMEIIMDRLELAPFLRGRQHLTKFDVKKLEQYCKSTGFRTIKSGTFSLCSPALALFGQNLADRVAQIEINHLKLFGPQIFLAVLKTE